MTASFPKTAPIYPYLLMNLAGLTEQIIGQDNSSGTAEFGLESDGEIRSSIVNLRMRAKEHSVSLVG